MSFVVCFTAPGDLPGGADDEEPERRHSGPGDYRDRGSDFNAGGGTGRFRVGISTAGAWYRRYRETGELEARKPGQPSRRSLMHTTPSFSA